jgi:hypothetical protein
MPRIVAAAQSDSLEFMVVRADLRNPCDFVVLRLSTDELSVLAFPPSVAQKLKSLLLQLQAPCFAGKFYISANAQDGLQVWPAGWVDEETYAVGEHLFNALAENELAISA